jgi:Tol biopolymer transport system component
MTHGKWLPRTMALVILLALAAVPTPAHAQSGDALYQQALRKERTEGDLRGAIALYERVVVSGSDRALAARALLRIGEAYEKLGLTEAQRAYERLVREYADQTETVLAAQGRLNALTAATATPRAAAGTGLSLRRIWHDPGVDMEGQPTPDGRLLTYVDWQTGDLAVRDLATEQHRLLTRTGYPAYALGSSVARDGRSVAYFWNTGEGPNQWQPQLRVVGIDGTGERTLIENVSREINYITPFEWTPDGAYVLVALQKRGGNEIALVHTRTGEVRTVKALDWRVPLRVALSPDGRWIAYDFPPDAESVDRDVFVLAADGTAEHRVTHHPANDSNPIWTPDGNGLLFSSERGGSVGLWQLRIANGRAQGDPRLIKADMTPGFYPMGFTPGGALFFTQDTGGGDIYTVAFDVASARVAGEPTRFVQRFQGLNTGGFMSGNGELLAYMSRRNALSFGHSSRLVLHDVRTGAERVLPVRSHRQFSRPRPSPDGRTVLLGATLPLQGPRVMLIDVATGEARTVAQPEGSPRGDATWAKDGDAFYYFRDDVESSVGTDPRIVRHRVATGEEETVYRFDVVDVTRTWALSPDERSIAYAGRERETQNYVVRVAGLEGGPPRELVRLVLPRHTYSNAGIVWTPDGEHVLYGVSDNNEWRGDRTVTLHAVRATGGEPQPVGLAAHELRHPSFLPDGRTLLFTGGPVAFAEVWVMEHPDFGRTPQIRTEARR